MSIYFIFSSISGGWRLPYIAIDFFPGSTFQKTALRFTGISPWLPQAEDSRHESITYRGILHDNISGWFKGLFFSRNYCFFFSHHQSWGLWTMPLNQWHKTKHILQAHAFPPASAGATLARGAAVIKFRGLLPWCINPWFWISMSASLRGSWRMKIYVLSRTALPCFCLGFFHIFSCGSLDTGRSPCARLEKAGPWPSPNAFGPENHPVTSPMDAHWWFGYGSIPINTIFSGMNIHLPAILMFTRGTRFWHTAIYPASGDFPSSKLLSYQRHHQSCKLRADNLAEAFK